jgi:hypothetical protein
MSTPDEQNPMDILIMQFARCADLGIEIPEDMPLDTEEHLWLAVKALGSLIRYRGGGPFGKLGER